MSFKKNKYAVIKQAVSKELVNFLYNYFLMKRQVLDTCLNNRYISPYEEFLGIYESKNSQIPNTYAHYSDIAMETLMLNCQPVMEKTTRLKLQPSYTYARIYKKGDELKRHKDRFSCEISTTMNLGGDSWTIYLEPNIAINLKQGDMLVYKGTDLEHWRKPFKGKDCVQVFLHYNNIKTLGSKDNMFDKRPHLGLPSWFKK
tara:strand:- start:55 stop:657 length:603 start_codon:yes stop_codon:yes gene_type:complete